MTVAGSAWDDLEALVTAVRWRDDHLEVLDQTRLPHHREVRRLRTTAEVVDALRRLVVRGAPAIGVCAGFGMVVGLDERAPADAAAARDELARLAAQLTAARPTAVNLAWAVERVVAAAQTGDSPAAVRHVALREAQRIAAEDRRSCRLIGEHGRAELAAAERILTHCNTGRLATGGIGTALGVVYAKAAAGEPVSVIATETRPLLQGARLTAWELADAGIDVAVCADGAAASLLAAGEADAVIVGCDRVAANGDVANKVGTFALAVAAQHHGVPFYVAGPLSTFDAATPTGADIPIEQRAGDEVRRMGEAVVAPPVPVRNPAFDVTPAALVTAFITDAGVLRPPYATSIGGALAAAG